MIHCVDVISPLESCYYTHTDKGFISSVCPEVALLSTLIIDQQKVTCILLAAPLNDCRCQQDLDVHYIKKQNKCSLRFFFCLY